VTALGGTQNAIQNGLTALDPNAPLTIQTLRGALRAAAQFAPERALVPSGAPPSALTDTANALLTEFAKRQAAVVTAQKPLTNTPPPDSTGVTKIAVATLQAVFGSDFFAMPAVAPPNEMELAQAFGANSTLVGGDTRAIGRFLQQAAHGRTQLEMYRKFALYARALGATAPNSEIAQLPFVPGETWLALNFTTPPDESRMSLVFISPTANLDPTLDWTGIVLDSWTEVIPSSQQPTSLAFNYNSPRPNAPQSVLVVAPSSAGANWTTADLVASLEETLDLAKVRAVDRELLDLGQVLPAIDIPNSLNAQVTVSSGNIGVSATLGSFFSVGFSS
jgi:hypothetical protein